MKKSSFTLIEVLISITIFSFVMITLYEVLDITRDTNRGFEKIVVKQENRNEIINIIIADIAQSTSKLQMDLDNDLNSRVFFESSNTFHNPYYNYITYLVSREKKLLRVESKDYLNEENLDSALNSAYVDTLMTNIEKFEIIPSKDGSKVYSIILKQENNEKILFSSLQVRNIK